MNDQVSKLVVLVEDNENEAILTRRAFRKNDFPGDLVVLEDGVELLDFLLGEGAFVDRDTGIMPDVIFLDLNLPRLNGLEALQRLRSDQRTRLLPVVVLTSSREQEDRIKSYGAGANSYIRKPVDYDKFLEVVNHLGLYWLNINEPPSKD